MIKVYKDKASGRWIAECTSLNILGEGLDAEDAIIRLCDILKTFLIKSYCKGKLEKILGNQKG